MRLTKLINLMCLTWVLMCSPWIVMAQSLSKPATFYPIQGFVSAVSDTSIFVNDRALT